MKTREAELIETYKITLHGEGNIAVPGGAKLPPERQQEIRAAKPAIIAELNRQREMKAVEEAEKAAQLEAEKQAIRNGEKTIEVTWHDGEYLSGWEVYGLAAKMLVEIEAAKPVDMWGYLVPDELVQALGKEFTYQQADDYTKPAREAKAAKKAAKEVERAEKIRRAQETREPVLLRKMSVPCNDPNEECNMDIIYEYAQPDGRITKTRTHTW